MATEAMLQEQTTALLAALEGWPAERLSYKPSSTSWSALQVLDHLVKTEEGILLLAKAGAKNPHRIGIKDRVRFIFIMKVFQTDRKVKVPPSASQVLPGVESNSEELRERWRKTRLDFKAFENELTPEQSRSGLFRHPVVGWMGMQQISDFFWVYLVHHKFQIERLALETK